MQVMNWKNNTLGRISIEIKCVLFSGKDKSSPREKKKNTSPPPNTHTSLHPGLSPLCLTMYMMWVCVFVSECLSVPLAYDHKHQEMLCYKSWSAASLGQHSRTLCLSYSEEKVLHFKSQKWMSGKLHVANKDKCSLLILADISSGPSATHTSQSCVSVIFFLVVKCIA